MILERLQELLKRLQEGGIGQGEAGKIIQRLIHGPLVALLVKLSPNKVDDMILDTLKAIIPPPA